MPEEKRELKDRIPICPHGNKDSIDKGLVAELGTLERRLGRQLTYNSGFRCAACNAAAGGVKNSAHMRGKAVDIKSETSQDRFEITGQALDQGFKRIGIGHKIVHLDIDETLPQNVAWLY